MPSTPDSRIHAPLAARILQALRAGPMSPRALDERFSGGHTGYLAPLCRAGLIVKVHPELYEITERGRRACPPRNSASAKPRAVPAMSAHVHGPTGTRRGGRYLGTL